MFFETLEQRSLFSVSLTAGVLTVTGTNLNDTITVSKNAAGQLSVNDGSVHNFAWNSVNLLKVNELAGNDVFTSQNNVNKPMIIHGGDGNDVIRSGGGNDTIYGDAGNDIVDGRQGDDEMFGGPGIDTVDYSDRTYNLTITLDDVNNDGGPGGHDNVHSDFENVYGGSGNDYIVGNAAANYIVGGAGNDSCYGNGGSDVLVGGNGNDLLSIGSGNGTAEGDDGNDIIYGGSGTGTNYLYGNAGNDTIYGYGNQNVMDGGDGNDYLNSFGTGTTWEYGQAGDDNLWGGYGQNVIYGGAGNDQIHGWSANTNWLYGEAGNDMVWGGSGSNVIDGGADNDILHGAGTGTNWVYGGPGDDRVYGGGSGTNFVRGDDGNDQLFGGPGVDYLNGGNGDDVIVSIGGGQSDVANGDAGFDSFWCDAEATEKIGTTDSFLDKLIEGAAGNVHRVGGFMSYRYTNGSIFPWNWSYIGVSRELNGQNLADPINGSNYRNFSDKPLFAAGGPNKDDIDQNALGDCYFLATLGATAKTDPNKIRQSVVDLGDGTYAVQFFNGGTPNFVRVDGDLPTDGAGNLVYAGLGTGNSLWSAVMEKAWAFYRHGDSDYKSIESGWMDEVFGALGKSTSTQDVNFFYKLFNNANSLWTYVCNELSAGKAVTVGTPGSTTTLIDSHAYMVDSVYTDGIGTHHVVLRNPWGPNNTNGNPYVDVTAQQLYNDISRVQSAFV